jgi:hypothetical protein
MVDVVDSAPAYPPSTFTTVKVLLAKDLRQSGECGG